MTRPISPYVKALALAGGVMVPALSQAQDMQGMPGMTMPSKPSSSAKPSTTPSQKTAPDIQAMPGMTMPANPQGGTTLKPTRERPDTGHAEHARDEYAGLIDRQWGHVRNDGR